MSGLTKLALRKIPAAPDPPEERQELFLKNDEVNSSLASRNHEFRSSVSTVNVLLGTPPSENEAYASLLIDSGSSEVLRKASIEQYEQQHAECEGLCEIDPGRIDKQDNTKMPCVTCPFCKQIVTAELTPTTIHCPACLITITR